MIKQSLIGLISVRESNGSTAKFLSKLEPGEASRHGGPAHESHQLMTSPSWRFSYASTFIGTSDAMLFNAGRM